MILTNSILCFIILISRLDHKFFKILLVFFVPLHSISLTDKRSVLFYLLLRFEKDTW